jgi:hypothetical protein
LVSRPLDADDPTKDAGQAPGIAAAGIERVPRTAGARDGLPLLEDGWALEAANVVWCTGFRPDLGWIDLPVLDADGGPRHDRGVVADQPGLYLVGLFFLTSVASSLVGGSATTPRTSPPRSPPPSPLRWQRACERRAGCTRSNRCCWR